MSDEKPPPPAVIALLVIVCCAFIGWSMAGIVSEIIGGWR